MDKPQLDKFDQYMEMMLRSNEQENLGLSLKQIIEQWEFYQPFYQNTNPTNTQLLSHNPHINSHTSNLLP